MKKIILLSCVFLILSVNVYAGNCTALNLSLKEISRSTQTVDVAFRADVRDNGQATTFFIPIQGIEAGSR